ncbi:hypothetical protein ABQZ69_10720, partial [Xanthomonas sp. WHRI 8391]
VAWITPQHQAGSVAYLWCVVQRFPSLQSLKQETCSLSLPPIFGGFFFVAHLSPPVPFRYRSVK